jgi:hypothetical protein
MKMIVESFRESGRIEGRATEAPMSAEKNTMQTTKYVYWHDEEMWLGCLEEYPDYRTQGETGEQLEENLRDIHNDLTNGSIPCVQGIPRLEAS